MYTEGGVYLARGIGFDHEKYRARNIKHTTLFLLNNPRTNEYNAGVI